MTTEADNKGRKHWATILLGVIVAVIFVVAIFSYQVNETQMAVITTFDQPSETPVGPGLHPRWFFPIQKVHKFDTRYRCYDGKVGKVEEVLTKDQQNVVVGIYIIYRIKDPVKFYLTMVNIPAAEEQLNTWMRGARSEVIGTYDFDQLINTNSKGMKLEQVEKKIKAKLVEVAGPIGLEIKSVGIKSLNIPEIISKNVFDRMISERNRAAQEFLSAGQTRADDIRIKTDGEVRTMLADSEAKAKVIRAEGDAKAAQFYATFKQNPELAIFLRKLQSLRKVMKSKTTLILDTDSAPFDIMKMDADQLKTAPASVKK
jgi:modulator of FtsH protease HflC